MDLTAEERRIAEGADGPAAAMAMRIVADSGRLMGANALVPIVSAHVDGCLYHGDSGVEFAERLVRDGGRVTVPTSLNVGALDLLHPELVRTDPHTTSMAKRQMSAYQAMGCLPTWTCAPYQAGHRPGFGEHVAWGESNAIAFANSVLGARTDRYGDFLDVCAALTGRAPLIGLHRDENRRANVVVRTDALSNTLKASSVFYPVLGAWLGAEIGTDVAVIDGLPKDIAEDDLKALGAAAASSGSVGLFHIAGVTPEAPDVAAVVDAEPNLRVIDLAPAAVRAARDRLSTVSSQRIDAIALGSPHFSLAEFGQLERLARGKRFTVPFYVCTGRGVLRSLEAAGRLAALRDAGIEIVVDTCVVVTPILPEAGPKSGRTLMTNSGKFAHYTPSNTGYEVVYGSLADCVATAETGRVVRDESLWQ